ECIASAAAETLRKTPTGAAAAERETEQRIGREVVIHAGGEAVDARGDVRRADRRIALRRIAAAIGRSPRGPALIEIWLARPELGGDVEGQRNVVFCFGRETTGNAGRRTA